MPPRANPARRSTTLAEAAAQAQATAYQPPTATLPVEQGGVAPNMISSLPPIASGADVYARQFYRGSKVPYRRYLPLGNL